MKIVFDTNVVMDVLTKREPFAAASVEAMALGARRERFVAAITANTVTDLYFLLRRHVTDRAQTKAILKKMVRSLVVLDTTRTICLLAFESPVPDFEDAVIVESARLWSADCIVSRDAAHFTASSVETITPVELLQRFGN